MKQTSINSYRSELESGRLSGRQREVLSKIKSWGAMTGREISDHIPSGHKRLHELEEMGLIQVVDIVRDGFTGKKVSLWDIAENGRPYKMVKRKTRKHLESEIMELKRELDRYPLMISTLYDSAYAQGQQDYADGRKYSGDNI